VEQSTDTVIVYGEVEILMISQKMSVIHRRQLDEKQSYQSFVLTGNAVLGLMQNAALPHVPVGIVLQSNSAPPHFLIDDRKREPIPRPPLLQI
jgi:hypothetical protein